MSAEQLLRDVLYIPKQHQRHLSSNRVLCLVHDDWLQSVRQKTLRDVSRTNTLTHSDAELLLAPSHLSLPRSWSRVCIKVIEKQRKQVPKLHNGPFYNTVPTTSCMEHLVQCGRENFRNLWAAAHVQYNVGDTDTFQEAEDQLTNVVRTYLLRLQPDIYLKLPEATDSCDTPTYHHNKERSNNIIPILAVIESHSVFFILQPYISYSLNHIVSYSPAVFSMSHAKSLFVLYQILQAMVASHKLGLSLQDLTLQSVLVDDKLWVYLSTPHLSHITDNSTVIASCNPHGSASAIEVSIPGAIDSENSSECTNQTISSATLTNKSNEFENSSNLMQRYSECENYVEEAKAFLVKLETCSISFEDLPKLTEEWTQHRISNFCYLMMLNYLAGRRMGDPNHHPVLPWVIDFTSANSGLRDLCMSKFRLNKGDSQLDFTYDGMKEIPGNTDHIPHHVSDVLSDITYFVYKARRTPKHLLCTYVRTKWVPNEYPSSIERMYQWTPDECIPEFFTDPSLFSSIHEDLPDLELPSWCSSASDLIDRHMAVLESEQVSQSLHHWIDLTFGYKLSGAAAVSSKNVYLQLVDQHKTVINHGVVQLFNQPHPSRPEAGSLLSVLPPRLGKFRKLPKPASIGHGMIALGEKESVKPDLIKLPDDFDPTVALDHFEAVHSFTCRACESLPPSSKKEKSPAPKFSDVHGSMKHVWADMQQFGCLMCELYLAPKLQVQNPAAGIQHRYSMIRQMCAKDRNTLPRLVQTAAEVLLLLDDKQIDKERVHGHNNSGESLLFEYPIINKLGMPPPSPVLLLQPYCNLLPFPQYFPELYKALNQMKDYDNEIHRENLDVTKSKFERRKIQKVLSRKKVEVIEKFLRSNKGRISSEGYELVLPYIKELFADSNTVVQAAWSLVGVVGKDLGSQSLSKNILPFLTKLFNGEETTPKHMKLYHRTFLVQLLLNLGLETFLSNFCTLLVEASAGYKDFLVDDLEDKGHEEEGEYEEDEDEDVFLSAQSQLNQTVASHEASQEQLEAQDTCDDVRPDQREDEEADTSYDVTEEDLLDEEFPNLSMGSNSRSVDSISMDQKSLGSCSLPEEEVGSLDRGSVDRASLHSISHIIEISQEKNNHKSENDQDWTDSDTKPKHNHVVHFDTGVPSLSSSLSSINQSKDSSSMQSVESKYGSVTEDQSDPSEVKFKSYMIRSETDEFRQIHYSHTINICDVAAESIKWLSNRLGPLLTAKHLSKNLVRMLALCYLGEEQLCLISKTDDTLQKTTRLVQGDKNAHKVLECLSYVSMLYGEQVIVLQYIPCIVDMVLVARKRLTVRAEAGLVAAVVLLRQIIPLLSDKTFLEILKENIVKEALRPLLKLVTSVGASFPSGSSVRSLILYKVIDALYVMGLRLGFEMTRGHLTEIIQIFFKPFGEVYSSSEGLETMKTSGSDLDLRDMAGVAIRKDTSDADDSFLNIKMDSATHQYMIGSPISVAMSPTGMMSEIPRKWRSVKSNYSLSENLASDDRDDLTDGKNATEENLQTELRQTFCPELALAAYIPLTSVFGSHHMEEQLPSDDLIRKLCAQFDKALYTDNDSTDGGMSNNADSREGLEPEGEFGSNVAMVGNRICLQGDQLGANPETTQLKKHFEDKGILRIDPDETKCKDMEHNKLRHLKGNWLAYWEHEKGLNARDTIFNFKQIKLQTFSGHMNSIRSLTCLDNENSFISASKDKTVKLWSITNFGDGTGRSRYQWSYDNHKKSVFSVAYLETMRLVASCDSTVHIWDPFTGDTVRQLESSRYSPVIALASLPSPSSLIMTATTDSTLRFLDLRTAKYAHEYKCVTSSSGLIRCIAASPDGSWVVVGFSSGLVSVLDLNTGMMLGTFKAHDSEILQLKAHDKNTFVSSSFDMNMKLWKVDDGKEVCSFKGHSEPVHCFSFYKNQIVSATTSNKIGVHTSVDSQANFSVTKLRSEVFKGVLTSMAILPLNRTLILGADNGLIRLLC